MTHSTTSRRIVTLFREPAIRPGRSRDCWIKYQPVATQGGHVPICAIRNFPPICHFSVPLNLIESYSSGPLFCDSVWGSANPTVCMSVQMPIPEQAQHTISRFCPQGQTAGAQPSLYPEQVQPRCFRRHFLFNQLQCFSTTEGNAMSSRATLLNLSTEVGKMDAIKMQQLLRSLHACEQARTWAKGKTLAEIWAQCERGDWLLWLCGKMCGEDGWPTRQEIVLAACDCAERSLKYVKKGEQRPRIAIETARKWARGNATIDEVRRAAAAAYAATADAYAAAYAATAAYDAADAYAAAAAYAYAAYAATAAYDAAYDATAAYAYAAYAATAAYDAAYASRITSLREVADIVRSTLYVPEIVKAAKK